MERDDIIEEVHNHTAEWVSSIVNVPKPNRPSSIRICIDMREVNKAIERERHITPTLDDIIFDLNGAKWLSKIDLKAGYNQIMVSRESRYITTFTTHDKLYQFKRLNFGISCAAEIFRNTIRRVLVGLEECRNVSDDILVHGSTKHEHDKRLKKTLKRLDDKGLTVNGEKCEFGKTELTFFGVKISGDGIQPADAKVKAVKEA